MAEEALLRSIIPAVAPAGHGLPQAAVFENLDETQAGIVAALVAVNQRLRIQGNAVFLYQDMYCLQNEVQFKRWAEDIRQDLLCKGVQDGGQVAENAAIRDVSNVCQEDSAWSMLFKFPVEQIVRHRVGTDRLCQPAVGIGLPYGAIQTVLTHEPLDFLHIHHDRLRQMQQPHMDTANALGVAPELVCLQNQGKVLLVPLLPRPPYILQLILGK